MRTLSWDEAVSGALGPIATAATIGVFDGFHVGHRALAARIASRSPGLEPLVVTFSDNPKRVVSHQRYLGNISTLRQKLDMLEEAGAKLCVLIDFSGNFSKLAGNVFISTLVRSCGVRYLVVGSDFRCGHGGTTNSRDVAALARGLDIEAEILEPVEVDGVPASSSRIRSSLAAGRMDLALAMLGRPYALDLRSVDVVDDGRTTKADLGRRGLALPAPGRYRADLLVDGGRRPAAVTVTAGGVLEWTSEGSGNPRAVEFGGMMDR